MTSESVTTPLASTLVDKEQAADHNDDSQEDISLGGSNDATSLSSLKAIRSENEDANETGQADRNDDVEEDPLLTRYHTACQKGDLATVKEMIHGKLLEVNKDGDSVEHITGLHWASINNRLSVVVFWFHKALWSIQELVPYTLHHYTGLPDMVMFTLWIFCSSTEQILP